jgi:Putative zinc-finger
MEHQEAQRTQAAERYLLGEFSADEREEFEEHYFSCPECAEEVRTGALLRANAAAVLLDEAQRSTEVRVRPQLGWLAWLGLRPAFSAAWAAACVLFAGGAIYQTAVVVPRLNVQLAEARAPQAFQDFVLHPLTRGEDTVVKVGAEGGYSVLKVHLSTDAGFARYRAEIRNESGAVLYPIDAATPAVPGDPLQFLVHSSSVPPGTYTLVVYGRRDPAEPGPGARLETYRFAVHQDK